MVTTQSGRYVIFDITDPNFHPGQAGQEARDKKDREDHELIWGGL